MTYHDEMTHDYADPALQSAFRAYFAELGCRVTNWEGLFAGMSEAGRDYTWTLRDEAGQVTFFMAGMDAQERDVAWVRRDESGRVVAFIQFTPMQMCSWFFRVKGGFIREFWVDPAERGRGHGRQLLANAEAWLRAQGCAFAILTTDTAPGFYSRCGYRLHRAIRARNQSPVYVKPLADAEEARV